MSRQRYRCWMFTLFEEANFELWEKNIGNNLSLVCGQYELCPKSGRKHFQGYVECNKAVDLTTIKKLLGSKSLHGERRNGSQKQALDYVSKKETRHPDHETYIIGNKKEQGKRNDLELALEMIKEGKTLNEVIDEIPNMIKYDRHLERYQQRSVEPRNFQSDVIVLIGEPGCGKTRFVFDKEERVYTVPESSSGTQWFDGYSGEEAVLIDDFVGNIRYNFMLQLCDRYPMRVNVKGGYVQWRPKRIYITSNYDIENWYNVDMSALKRRITTVHKFGTEVVGNTRPPLPA